MADGDPAFGAGDAPPPATPPKPETDGYAPSAQSALDPVSALPPPKAFNPNATIEDPELATRTVVKASDAPALGRDAPRADGSELTDRYQLLERTGATAGGQAYTGTDNALERPVAVKVLSSSRALDPMRRQRFFHEARVAARLRHPNILPIYDLDQTPGGDLYFTTAHLSGQTLDVALRLAKAGARPHTVQSWRHIATIVLKTAEAVAYAHDQGLLHRDLKPEHIALGDNGEVQVGGWQWAKEVDATTGTTPAGVVGTPAYMSPEQARGEKADRRADVYALGAILFEALTLEVPIADADEDLFWKLKKAGRVPEPVLERHRDAPRHLLACALAALDPFPARRPADARAFAQALLAALDRQIAEDLISGHERRRQRRRVLAALAALAVLAGAGTIAAPLLRDHFNRPPVVLQTDFASNELPASLRVLRGFSPTAEGQLSDYAVSNGRLASKGEFHNYLFFDRMLTGRVQVEFTARWDRAAPVGEISLVWVPRDPFTSERPLDGCSYLQVGAWDNDYSSIFLNYFSKNLGGARATISGFRLEPDRDYRLRFTIDGALYRIEADGVLVTEFRDPSVPQRSGWVGIYTTRAGKQIDDLVIRSDRSATVPITAVAEGLLREGHADEAVIEFERIARSLDGQVSSEARYRQGVALMRAGKPEQARTVWDGLRDPPWSGIAAVQALEIDFEAKRHDAVLAGLRTLYGASPETRQLVPVAWSRFAFRAADTGDPEVERYLELQASLMPDDKPSRKAAAGILAKLGRRAEVVEKYADCALEAAGALLALGREQEVIDRYPHRIDHVQRAMLNLGRLREVSTGVYSSNQLLALVLEGRAAEVLPKARFPGDSTHALAAASLGRWDGIEQLVPDYDRSSVAVLPLLAADKLDEALARKPGRAHNITSSILLRLARPDEAAANRGNPRMVLQWRAVDALARGDAAAAAAARAELAKTPLPPNVEQPGWLVELILLPLADQLAGKSGAFEEAKSRIATEHPKRWAGMAWHSAMHIDGLVDQSRFAGQPVQLMVPALDLVCEAVRAELKGEPEAATHWRAYLALPFEKRLWGVLAGDPAVDRFAQWRALGAPAPEAKP